MTVLNQKSGAEEVQFPENFADPILETVWLYGIWDCPDE
jgi:hypothetical protein